MRFSDAGAIPDWARQAVDYAAHQGLVAGYPDNTFRPDSPITRAEAAVLLDHALKIFASGAGNDSLFYLVAIMGRLGADPRLGAGAGVAIVQCGNT